MLDGVERRYMHSSQS